VPHKIPSVPVQEEMREAHGATAIGGGGGRRRGVADVPGGREVAAGAGHEGEAMEEKRRTSRPTRTASAGEGVRGRKFLPPRLPRSSGSTATGHSREPRGTAPRHLRARRADTAHAEAMASGVAVDGYACGGREP